MKYPKPNGYLVIDAETLCKWDTAVILSLGACYFSDAELKQGHLGVEKELEYKDLLDRSIEWKFNAKEQLEMGRTTSPSVIQFWQSQPDAVRKMVCGASENDISILNIISVLQQYLMDHGTNLGAVRLVDRRHFDISKLQHIAETCLGHNKTIWNYKVTLEISLMLKLFTGNPYGSIDPNTFNDKNFIYHNAKCDAALDAFRMFKEFAGNTEF